MAVSLPDELVEEVLQRLPVKPLMRFKCVKKSWNTLFKTNTFVKKQRERQKEKEGFDERFIILNLRANEEPSQIKLLSSKGPSIIQLPSQYPYVGLDECVPHAWAHCNGVMMVDISVKSNGRFTIMWNPATREVNFLPPNPLQPAHAHLWFTSFGADPNTFNDLRVIKVYYWLPNHSFYAFMYSSSTNSWTTLPNLRTSVLNEPDFASVRRSGFSSSAFANGVGYHISNARPNILCFDFRSNEFRNLKAPPTCAGKVREAGNTVVFITHCFLPVDESGFGFEIWTLKEETTWTKLCRIQPSDCFNIYGVWKDCTEFIGESEEWQLVSYNLNSQPVHQFQIDLSNCFFTMLKYEESIAPLSLF